MTKFVIAPLSIQDMDSDLESKEIYIYDYKNSLYKNDEFYDYITGVNALSDIHIEKDVSYSDKELLLIRYMNDKRFLHFYTLNITIFNLLNLYKGNTDNILSNKLSIFTKDEEKLFLDNHYELISKWKSFYDSLFMFNLCLATLPENCSNKLEQIKKRFEGININNTDTLSPNMVSLLLDDYFFTYYDSGINESLVEYYPYYFENNLYDEKSIITYLLSPNNYYLDIINKSIYNEEFKKFLSTF